MLERAQAAQELAHWGRWIMDKGLTWGNAGNLSARLDADHILVTASGTRMGCLTDKDFAVLELSTGKSWDAKPSKEAMVHAALYKACAWAGAAMHASPPYATAFSLTGLSVRNDLFVENMYYLQRVCRLPYAHPGSKALEALALDAAVEANVLLLANHGVLLYDTCLAETATALEVLEQTCRMQLRQGPPLEGLPPEVVEDFLLRSGYKPARVWGKG